MTKQRRPFVDAHLDLAFNAVAGFDPCAPLAEARAGAWGQGATRRGMTPTVTLPTLRDAGARVVFGTLFVMPSQADSDLLGATYSSPAEAHDQAQAQLAYYQGLAARGELQLLRTRADLAALLAADDAPLGLVTLMEGADPIREPAEVAAWFDAGVRLVGPAWGATRYSGGTRAPGPLTAAGRELIAAMSAVGMALDVSHMAEASFWEALELHRGAVCASHSNARERVPTDRHLSDDMIRALIGRDAVIGVVLYNRFLHHEWTPGSPKAGVGLGHVVAMINHICAVAGDRQHIGIGSDFDGGFGVEGLPDGIELVGRPAAHRPGPAARRLDRG